MNLVELLNGTGYSIENDKNILIKGITCDSRRVASGWLFVCIKGSIVDGHDFASGAMEQGAAVIVTEHDMQCDNQIVVSSAREFWSIICANWFKRPAEKLKLIGVTGTNGKTSVTYYLKSVLESFGEKVGLVGTIQNMIGGRSIPATQTTPDSYDLQSMFALMVAEGCKYVVMEVSSHALDQDRVGTLKFDIAVFTNLTQDHLDYHKTMEEYLSAKKKLFLSCKNAVVNLDDEYAKDIIDACSGNVITFSTEKNEADYVAKNIRFKPNGVDFELVHVDAIARVNFPALGMFSVQNALATAVCAILCGLEFMDVTDALGKVSGVKGRIEVVPTDRKFTIVIDYAHTPDSIEKACQTLKVCTNGRLFALFGCGGNRDVSKRALMGKVASENADVLIITSDNPRSEDPFSIINDILEGVKNKSTEDASMYVEENRKDAISWAIKQLEEGDILLLAGKGHETYQIVNDGKIHFDEREIVREELSKLD